MSRFQMTWGALVLVQALHSAEEYVGRLWETFPPARFLTGLVSQDLERGFLVINVSLVAFGLWCWLWPVRKEWPSLIPLTWFWITIETINGLGHPIWTLLEGSYTAGVATAPLLLVLAVWLASQMRKIRLNLPV